MSKIYDVVAITGTYTDATGRERNRYATLGAVIESRNGLLLKLDLLPINWNGTAFLNTPRPRDGQPSESPRRAPERAPDAPAGGDFTDDIPF